MSISLAAWALSAFATLSPPHQAPATATPALGPWSGPADVELYSAVLTAKSCAQRIADTGDLGIAISCSPIEGARTGFAIYDPVEEQVYVVDPAAIYTFELEHGFGGSIDILGEIKGTVDGLPMIVPEEYSISPKPTPGAFKGCL